MTGLEAIWASGTICTVGATARGLIIGQPLFPEHSDSPLTRPEHPNHSNTQPSCSYSPSVCTIHQCLAVMDKIRTPVFTLKISTIYVQYLLSLFSLCQNKLKNSATTSKYICIHYTIYMQTNSTRVCVKTMFICYWESCNSCDAITLFAVCLQSCSSPENRDKGRRQDREGSSAYLRQHSLCLSITHKHTTFNNALDWTICHRSAHVFL